MEMALSSSATAFSLFKHSKAPMSPSPSLSFEHPIPRSKSLALNNTHEGKPFTLSATGRFGSLSGGAGVLERPIFDQSQSGSTPEAEEGGDIGRVRDRRGPGCGDSYRVLLIDDTRHTEKLVVKVLPLAVPSVTLDDAKRLFRESRERGVAIVIVAVKEHAEFYSQMMLRGGLRSAIEPDSNKA